MDEDLIIAAIDDEIGKLQQVRALLSEVTAATDPAEEATPTTQETVKRRSVSPAARRRMAEAQKKRWAAVNAKAVKVTPAEKVEEEVPAGKATGKNSPQRRGMSPAARKRIAAAQKKRWAAVKAAKSTPTKKTAKKASAKKSAAAKKAPTKAVTKGVRKTAVKKAVSKSTKKAAAVAKKAATVNNAAAPAKATEAAPF